VLLVIRTGLETGGETFVGKPVVTMEYLGLLGIVLLSQPRPLSPAFVTV
jgi:hypothetical protein